MDGRDNKSGVIGASVGLGLILCLLVLSKVVVPILTVLLVFVGLPVFWHCVVARMTEDPMVRFFCMFCAFVLIAAVSYL